MRREVALAWCSLALACASAPRGPDDPAHIELVYGWKPGLACDVAVEASSLQQIGEAKAQAALRASYRLSTEDAGDNLRVRASNLDIWVDDAHPTGTEVVALTEQIAKLPPDLLVNAEGRFAGIDDVPGFQARIGELLKRKVPGRELSAEFIDHYRERILSEPVLVSTAHDTWNGIVGSWLFETFEVAAPHTREARIPEALLPEEEVLIHNDLSATQRAPCARGSVERSCVELEIHTSSDAEASARILQKFTVELMSTLKPSLGDVKVSDVSIVTEAHLVTEPDGLIPHYYAKIWTTSWVAVVDGQSIPIRQEKRVAYTFAY